MSHPSSTSFRSAWALIKPYWFSDERWRARFLLAAIVALALGQVYLAVLLNQWNAVFYNALQDKKYDVFLHQLFIFAGLATAVIVVAVYRQYLNQMLTIRWRTWMTKEYQTKWLGQRAYYRLQTIYNSTDNPDQRIAEDIDMFTRNTLSLSISLLSSVVTLFSFVTILWGLSGVLDFHLGGYAIHIPGYMVWAALLYSIVGTVITHYIGRRLVKLNFDHQRFEANYRFSLIRIRENAESVAFYKGEQVEQHHLNGLFSHVFVNFWQIIRKQKQMTWFTAGYSQIAIIFPFIVAAPRYFSGAIQLGGLMQTASAFGRVQDALSWFIDAYGQFATWKATADRLHGFRSMIDLSNAEDTTATIAHTTSTNAAFEVQQLSLTLPDGTPLLTPLDLTLKAGDRLLLTGPSGSGKTTMLRAVAGLWPYGTGSIALPQDATLLFVPQKPYLPHLTLREIICYPHASDVYDDTAVTHALTLAGLAHLAAELGTVAQWDQSLSLGEQQKIAFARIFLQRPQILLLDEVTASLDAASEATLYRTLLAELPHSIVLSIGHRSTLAEWHTATHSIRT